METVLSVLIFAICIFIPLVRRVKKQVGDDNRPSRRRGWMSSAVEDIPSDAGIPKGVDGLGEPYFSYEYEESSVPNVQRNAPRQQPATAPKARPVVAVENIPAVSRFDLRQAVIYQTVLHNPYIAELNQSIQ